MRGRQHGFNLYELMMALVVAGIVLGIGVPSFRDFHQTNLMAAATNELATGVLFARSEAVKRQVPVTLCTTPDPAAAEPSCAVAGANGAFIVFVDTDADARLDAEDTILARRASPGGALRMWAESDYVTYGGNGFPRQAEGRPEAPTTRIVFCDDRGNSSAAGGASTARVVAIEPAGRGAVRQDSAMVTEVIAALGADCGG